MRGKVAALIASAVLSSASPTVFSVHDDILAFPQYEVRFSDSHISDQDANTLLEGVSSPLPADSTGLQHQDGSGKGGTHQVPDVESGKKERYERMYLEDQEYLCSIPIVEILPRNETSEAEARAEEQKELARATDRGWELLQGLQGQCLYFISGWWSYSFCYNSEVTQFHQLAQQPGRPITTPQRDPSTAPYILGRVKTQRQDKDDEWGSEVEVRKEQKVTQPPGTELQVKGDSRYLVQKMDHGTNCDLTGKPRRIEVQYHCKPGTNEKIGYVREVTTCSYLMVIHTPRLCNDVAFLPPKETKANTINCRMVLADDEVSYLEDLKALETELATKAPEAKPTPLTVGGIVLGGNKHFGDSGYTIPLPPNWALGSTGPATDVIARSKSKQDGGKVEVLSEEALSKLDLDPEVVEQLKEELQKMAGDKGWKLEIVDIPGDVREIRGIVEGEEDEEGSEENYKDEL